MYLSVVITSKDSKRHRPISSPYNYYLSLFSIHLQMSFNFLNMELENEMLCLNFWQITANGFKLAFQNV